MKEVSTKQIKRRRKEQPLLLSLSVLILAALIYLLSRPAALPPPEPLQDTSVSLFEAEAKDLVSFTVKRPNEAPYTVSLGGGYSLEEYASHELNHQMIEHMAESLSFLVAEDTLENDIESASLNLEEFGLGAQALEIQARFSDAREYTILIGSRIPGDRPRDYAMLQGSKVLYAFSITLKDEFDHPKTWLHTVPDINFTPDLLDSLRIETKEETLSVRRVFDDVWMMDIPFSYPVSMEKIETLKTHINNMRFAGYVEPASRLSLKDYGLEDPAFRVTFQLSASILTKYAGSMQAAEKQYIDAQELVLTFGHEINGIGYYCLFDGTVYQVTKLSMGFLLDTDVQTWLSRYPVNVPMNRIDTFSAAWGGERARNIQVSTVEDILPNNDLSRNELGEVLYHFVLTDMEGQEVDLVHGLELYKSLMAVRAVGAVGKASPAEKTDPLLMVELNFGDTSRIIKYYPYDALHALIEVDGTSLYYTDMSYLEEVRAALSQLSEK